jgi:hypothetical protein
LGIKAESKSFRKALQIKSFLGYNYRVSYSKVNSPNFLQRRKNEIKSIGLIATLLVFYWAYSTILPVKTLVDIPVVKAVSGLTLAYGTLSTYLFEKFGVDWGFVSRSPDPEFLFNVRVATAINERRAGPLIDFAVDSSLSRPKREQALRALLQFDSVSEWIQPFLNELPKGGMVELNESNSPILDELIKRIRKEGGIRQPLVRAYAEVVFSFLMQVPDAPILRQQALRWLPDVLPEETLFLVLPRVDLETDPAVRTALTEAVWNVRAVSDPERAKALVVPLYRVPPWPEFRVAAAVVLSRLGYRGSTTYLRENLKLESFSQDKRMVMDLALAQKPYPTQVELTAQAKLTPNPRVIARQKQYEEAVRRQEEKTRQAKLKEVLIAKVEETKLPAFEEPVKAIPVAPAPPAKTVPKKQTVKRPPVVVPVAPAVVPPVQAPPVPVEVVQQEKVSAVPMVVPHPVVEEVVIGFNPPETTIPKPSTMKSEAENMRSVNLLFEVKKKQVPLYAEPNGKTPTGEVLPLGSKGQVNFKVQVGSTEWYQVKSKKGKGWARGNSLELYDLSQEVALPEKPALPEPAVATAVAPPETKKPEYTYFEPNSDTITAFKSSTDKSEPIGTLVEGVAYLALQSEKVGVDRWFYLEIKKGVGGWVRGIDLQLADIQQPPPEKVPELTPEQRAKQVAGVPAWVVANNNGVGVFLKTNIQAKRVRLINLKEIFQVVDMAQAQGIPWYKIQLSPQEVGWVQASDVEGTKPLTR